MNYLAIDVGGTFTKYAVITGECEIIKKDKKPTVLGPLDALIEFLTGIYQATKEEYEIAGIALSMPGMIDSRQGFMYTGGNLKCINNLNIVELMELKCGIPVTVENDAKCAAFAELWQGALKDCENAVVIVCGTGIGGAVIRNREVLNGSHFLAGEFSYVITKSEEYYKLENCLAENAGIPSLIRYVSEETNVPAEKLNGEKIFSMANCGDEKAMKGLKRFVSHLAIQIHNYQYVLDPERFAIGGGISVQPIFIQLIKEELKKINDIFPWALPSPEVVVCKYFNDANLIGAVYVHLRAKEKKINLDKMKEFMKLVGERREGDYLRELLMD